MKGGVLRFCGIQAYQFDTSDASAISNAGSALPFSRVVVPIWGVTQTNRDSRLILLYPPVIGGKKAISRAPSMRAFACTWILSIALRITFGFSKA